MASYNGAQYISEQIASILPQLAEEDELIISDDGSKDETIEIIRSFNDSRIKLYFCNTKNHMSNFENALSKASGEYIFMSDQDDIWLDDKVMVSMKYLKEVDLVLSDCILIGNHREKISLSYFSMRKAKAGFFKNFYKNSFTGCCMAFNRKILMKCLPFPANIKSHDTWIGLIAEIYGKTLLIYEPLIYLRRHGNNFSTNSGNDAFITGESSYKLHQILIHRLYLLYSLIIRIFHK